MIHVAYGTSNLYAKFAATSMLSMFENTSENVTVHILHDDSFSQENRDKFIYIAEHYNQTVNFYNVEKLCAAEIAEFKSIVSFEILKRFNIATYLRLLVANVVSESIEKIISIDADTIINLDIAELWQIELGDKPLAAVPEWEKEKSHFSRQGLILCRDGVVAPEDYFNLGLTILNLNKWRHSAEIIKNGLDFICKNYTGWDQDTLNYCFSTQYLKLPAKFNCWVNREKAYGRTDIQKNLYHYLGRGESLGLNLQDNYNRLFWEYFAKTPFFNAETIGKLFTGFLKVYEGQQNSFIKVSAMLIGKTRTFITDVDDVEGLQNIFNLQANEEIILISAQDTLGTLVNFMEANRNDKVFFFIISNPRVYKKLRDFLQNCGFVENQDFFNAALFLSESQGGLPIDCWDIIQNL